MSEVILKSDVMQKHLTASEKKIPFRGYQGKSPQIPLQCFHEVENVFFAISTKSSLCFSKI